MQGGYSFNNINQLTKEIGQTRNEIKNKKNISNNIQSLESKFNQMENYMRDQDSYLKNFNSNLGNTEDNKELQLIQIKKNMEKFIIYIKNDIQEFIQKCIRLNFNPPRQEKSEEIGWEKIADQVNHCFDNVLNSLEKTINYTDIISYILNIRESLTIDIIKSYIYRKFCLWEDMNMPFEEYVHSQVKEIMNWQSQQNEKYKYQPEFPEFEKVITNANGPFKLQNPTEFSFISIDKGLNLPEQTLILQIFTNSYNEMLAALRNYAQLNQDDTQRDVNQNQGNIKSLRQIIENLNIQNQTLQKRIQEINENTMQDEPKETQFLEQKIQQLENQNRQYKREIDELKKSTQGTTSQMQWYKERLDAERLQNDFLKEQHISKLDELTRIQSDLNQEFKAIKKEIEQFSKLFYNEASIRKKIQEEKDYIKIQFDKAVNLIGNEKIRSKEIKKKMQQKEDIVMEVMDFQKELEEQNKELKKQLQIKQDGSNEVQDKIKNQQNQINELNTKLDELQKTNQFLNKRVNGLEDHKKKLLDILKDNKIDPGQILYS